MGMADLSRRQWLRAASGLFVAAPIAHYVFAPKFGSWFRKLWQPRYNPYEWHEWIVPTRYLTLEELQRQYNDQLSKIMDSVASGEQFWGISYSRFPRTAS